MDPDVDKIFKWSQKALGEKKIIDKLLAYAHNLDPTAGDEIILAVPDTVEGRKILQRAKDIIQREIDKKTPGANESLTFLTDHVVPILIRPSLGG